MTGEGVQSQKWESPVKHLGIKEWVLKYVEMKEMSPEKYFTMKLQK